MSDLSLTASWLGLAAVIVAIAAALHHIPRWQSRRSALRWLAAEWRESLHAAEIRAAEERGYLRAEAWFGAQLHNLRERLRLEDDARGRESGERWKDVS